MSELSQPVQQAGHGRGLSTARSVLKVLTLLAEHPDGVRACDVAERVGKSTSTAYYLLASLCEEGFAVRDGPCGRYRLQRDGVRAAQPSGHLRCDDLEPAVDALFLRTRKRCYLGRVERGGIEIVAVRGRQGLAKIPGLGSRIGAGLHALAMGKVVLSLLPDEARRRYARRGLRSFTDATITSPQALLDELEEVRRRGVAIEREEFQPDFCCVAAPMRDLRGRFLATVGLSATTRAFDIEREQLVEAVLDAAAMSKHVQKTREILRREAATA